MTDTQNLQDALAAYRKDHGQAAADALVLNTANPQELKRLGAPLRGLKSQSGRTVHIGDATLAEIMEALAALCDEDVSD